MHFYAFEFNKKKHKKKTLRSAGNQRELFCCLIQLTSFPSALRIVVYTACALFVHLNPEEW